MMYTLSIPEQHQAGVVAILQSLKDLGLIASIAPTDEPDFIHSDAEVLPWIEAGEADIQAGRVFSTAEVRERIVKWNQQ